MIFDYLKQLKRGPQVVLPKDAFIIIGFAGLRHPLILYYKPVCR